jgi:formylglycine-generating enzyme required for sulfatase activity
MKLNSFLTFMFSITFIMSSATRAQEQEETMSDQKKFYSEIAGRYELDMEGRVVPFCIAYKPSEGRFYFEATDEISEAMDPVKGKESAFYTYDPNGNDVELIFYRNEKGEIAGCEVTILSSDVTFQAVKDLKYEGHLQYEHTTPVISDHVNDKILDKLDIEFVYVPGGSFQMGDTFGEGGKTEYPVHDVTLDDFYLSKTEVTFEQFDRFCQSTGRDKPGDEGWGRGSRPVINVDFDDATAFCQWLSRESGRQIRLPTEAEWEYAAREGGKKIRFGNGKNTADPSEINYDGSDEHKGSYSVSGESRQKTMPVASFSPNALDLYDMAGNVWEWCEDWFDGDYYKNSVPHNPRGPSFTRWFRVIRGGCWDSKPSSVRCTARGRFTPDDPSSRERHLGFRIVMTK